MSSEGLKCFSLCGFLAIAFLKVSLGISSVGFRWRRRTCKGSVSSIHPPNPHPVALRSKKQPHLRLLAAVWWDYLGVGGEYLSSFVRYMDQTLIPLFSSLFTCPCPTWTSATEHGRADSLHVEEHGLRGRQLWQSLSATWLQAACSVTALWPNTKAESIGGQRVDISFSKKWSIEDQSPSSVYQPWDVTVFFF